MDKILEYEINEFASAPLWVQTRTIKLLEENYEDQKDNVIACGALLMIYLFIILVFHLLQWYTAFSITLMIFLIGLYYWNQIADRTNYLADTLNKLEAIKKDLSNA